MVNEACTEMSKLDWNGANQMNAEKAIKRITKYQVATKRSTVIAALFSPWQLHTGMVQYNQTPRKKQRLDMVNWSVIDMVSCTVKAMVSCTVIAKVRCTVIDMLSCTVIAIKSSLNQPW